jgi:hypothetical protein
MLDRAVVTRVVARHREDGPLELRPPGPRENTCQIKKGVP